MISLLINTLLGLIRSRRSLVLENLALRQQLAILGRSGKRPHLTNRNRLFWVFLSRIWSAWKVPLIIVKPETVIRWHRKGFKLYWTFKSRKKRSGRPKVSLEIRKLIGKMSSSNSLWGAPRIHGELLKLGFDVCEAAISKYLIRSYRPPSQTWKTFLKNHVETLVSTDFFTVPTVTFRILYVFVVLAHDRRRVRHFNVTASPSAEWIAQQIREAFPGETTAKYPLRDRDRIYGTAFSKTVEAIGIKEVKTAPHSPWQNPYVERMNGTFRRECVDHVIVIHENQLRRILREYLSYYHSSRTHLSLNKDSPDSRPIEPMETGTIIEMPMVGGLHHRYMRQAA